MGEVEGDLLSPALEERNMLAPDVSPGLRWNKITRPKGATFVFAPHSSGTCSLTTSQTLLCSPRTASA
jgi:hypothetical protein